MPNCILIGYIRIAIQPITEDDAAEPTNRQSTSSTILRFSDDDYFPAMAKHSVSHAILSKNEAF